ncbi:hypothetical protein RintRC_3094 [Richelia intracellularis]|nr:hypothetical protein RintRC_3094 [Richelia intracellularis]
MIATKLYRLHVSNSRLVSPRKVTQIQGNLKADILSQRPHIESGFG